MYTYTYIYIIYIYKMEKYSAIKRITFCHLQQYGWTWKVLRLGK